MPEKDFHNFDEQLRHKFENFGSEPSGKVWESIAAGIETENRKKRRFWVWLSLAALLFMFTGSVAWFLKPDKPINGQQLSHSEHTTERKAPENHMQTRMNDRVEKAKAETAVTQQASGNDTKNINASALKEEKRYTPESAQGNTYKPETGFTETSLPGNKAIETKQIRKHKAESRQKAETFSKDIVVNTASKKSVTGKPGYNRSASTKTAGTKAEPGNSTSAGVPHGTNPAIIVEPEKNNALASADISRNTAETRNVTAIDSPEKKVNSAPGTQKTAPESPFLKGKVAQTINDVTPAPASKMNSGAAAIVSKENKESATAGPEVNQPEMVTSKTTGTSGNVTGNSGNAEQQTALTTATPVAAASDSAANTIAKIAEEPVEESAWKVDTAGLSVYPPKDTTEIKPPNAIPVRAVDIFASPEYGFRTLGGSNNAALANFRNEHESWGLGFSGGVNMTFGLTKKLGIRTGLQYTELRENLNYPDALLLNKATHSSYKFVTLPLYLAYERRGYSNFSVEFSAGPNLNLFVGGQSIMQNADNTYRVEKWSDSGHNFKPYTLSGTAAIGFTYRVSKVVSLMLRPTVTYFPWSIANDSQPAHKPYSVGAQTGIRFGF